MSDPFERIFMPAPGIRPFAPRAAKGGQAAGDPGRGGDAATSDPFDRLFNPAPGFEGDAPSVRKTQQGRRVISADQWPLFWFYWPPDDCPTFQAELAKARRELAAREPPPLEAGFDELLYRAEHRLFWRRLPQWEADFVRGVSLRAKRRGWRPSVRQVEVLRSIVQAPQRDALIDEGDAP